MSLLQYPLWIRNCRTVSCWNKQVSPLKVMTWRLHIGSRNKGWLVGWLVILWLGEEIRPLGCLRRLLVTSSSLTLLVTFLFISHQYPLPVVSHLLKVLSLFFFNSFPQPLFFLIMFLARWWYPKAQRGQREYWPLKGVGGPKFFYCLMVIMTLPLSVCLLIFDCWKS